MKKLVKAAAVACLAGAAVSSSVAMADEMEEIVNRAVHVCNACHGENGNSTVAVYPKLAGQQPLYIASQLKLFRSQHRNESDPQAYMWGVSALLDDKTIQGLAEYYGAQTPPAARGDAGAKDALGRKIYEKGIPARKVPACGSCHGENGEGAAMFPRLAGQHAGYTFKQLAEFRTKLRPYAVVMTNIVKNLTNEEMRAVALYLAKR